MMKDGRSFEAVDGEEEEKSVEQHSNINMARMLCLFATK